MKVSLGWLKELVEYNLTSQSLADKLSLNSIGVKELTNDYLELDLTYNRGDLLSLRGVAQEIAAVTGSKLLFSLPGKVDSWAKDLPETPVIVVEKNLCPVYCVAKIEGLKVQPSDQVWDKKLSDSGIRSVNNIADVTNLVMLEYGQPMHAFDADKVVSQTLIVRTAKTDEELVTLDNKKRKLSPEDLLIADPGKVLGLAGVMGGKDSEVSESTTDILLEAAIFDPISNRNSSKRHGLYSEASKRFQHGLTKTNLLKALQAAIKMYESLGGELTAITLVGDLEDRPQKVNLSQSKLNELLGEDIDPKFVVSSLESLSFKVEKSGEGEWIVTPPYFRLDISIEEDLIEEVARMYGYEKIPSKELKGKLPEKIDQTLPNFIYDLKKVLSEAGLTEVQTYSFYSSKTINYLRLTINDLVKVANPISSETEFMRDNLWPNLLEVVAKNTRQGYRDIAIFEIGKVYHPKKGDSPCEAYRLSIALVNGTNNPTQELNQIFQSLRLHLKEGKLKVKKYFHPVRFSSTLAEVHPRFVNKFGIEQRVAILEVELKSHSHPN
ncbi:phenylalanine--tRNA ligase subunit beta [Candidatus Daviesbacteria bacterium]|nr:phenylalanine--tRNA ligase subunit beta [Candidatus Daviesbacteria bacterium]